VDGLFVISEDPSADLQVTAGQSFVLATFSGTVVVHNGSGTVWDTVGYGSLATNTVDGFPSREGNALAALTTTGSAWGRNSSSADTGDNQTDFIEDVSPSAGGVDALVKPTLTTISPDNTLAHATVNTPNVVLTGTGFESGATVKFGSNDAADCVMTGNGTVLTCTAPANSGVGFSALQIRNPTGANGRPNATFRYTGVLNETDSASEADFCVIVSPAMTFTVNRSVNTSVVGGIKETGAPNGFSGEVGYALNNADSALYDPRITTGWRWSAPTSNGVQNVGDTSQYDFTATLTSPATITGNSQEFRYAFRFTSDQLNYTYCDLNGAGSEMFMALELGELGIMTVNQ
jgi:hypothetical protein